MAHKLFGHKGWPTPLAFLLIIRYMLHSYGYYQGGLMSAFKSYPPVIWQSDIIRYFPVLFPMADPTTVYSLHKMALTCYYRPSIWLMIARRDFPLMFQASTSSLGILVISTMGIQSRHRTVADSRVYHTNSMLGFQLFILPREGDRLERVQFAASFLRVDYTGMKLGTAALSCRHKTSRWHRLRVCCVISHGCWVLFPSWLRPSLQSDVMSFSLYCSMNTVMRFRLRRFWSLFKVSLYINVFSKTGFII